MTDPGPAKNKARKNLIDDDDDEQIQDQEQILDVACGLLAWLLPLPRLAPLLTDVLC